MIPDALTSRERVTRVLAGEIPDRVPMFDSYWIPTIERWQREGLPTSISPATFFGTDDIMRIGGDYTMQFPERVLEETADSRLYWDTDGALRRDLHVEEGWTSQWLEFTIKTPDDWTRYREQMAFSASRIPDSAVKAYEQARAEDRFICYTAHACFHPTWMRVGMEQMLMLMLDDPDFINTLFADHVQLIIDIYEGFVARGLFFDGAFMADDLGYQVAPLISPKLYRELVYPHHKRLCDRFAQDGLKTILHSDGHVTPLIPHFLDAGFAGLHPLEAKAGLDVRDLKPGYGDRLVLIGNIDVRKLASVKGESRAEMRARIETEVGEKVRVAKEGGGYIYHSDHSVPNDVSLEAYTYAIEMVKRYGTY